MADIVLTEDQVLHFRARRGHLAGPGAKNANEAAKAILGAQAQQLPPALWALSLRTRGRPTAEALKDAMLAEGRSLARVWGQRDTLHIYDPASHWADVIAAYTLWTPGGRRGEMPPPAAVKAAAKRLHTARGPLTRSDLFDLLPAAYLRQAVARIGSPDAARRFAAGRLIWKLSLQGDLCVAGRFGAEQCYASRIHAFPNLDWELRDAKAAAARLTEDYLAVYGPATPQDIAHFFGARVGTVRGWLEALASEVVSVTCGPRKELLARRKDARALRKPAPRTLGEWPIRLLPLYDSMLMGHADKSWTVPHEAECKAIWRKAAFVAAVVLARGRIVATWTQKARSKHLDVAVQPLRNWRASHLASVRREAGALAAHLGLALGTVDVDDRG